MKCRAKQDMKGVTYKLTKRNARQARGTCSACGTAVYAMVPKETSKAGGELSLTEGGKRRSRRSRPSAKRASRGSRKSRKSHKSRKSRGSRHAKK